MKVTVNIFFDPPKGLFDLFKSFGEIGNFVFPFFTNFKTPYLAQMLFKLFIVEFMRSRKKQ